MRIATAHGAATRRAFTCSRGAWKTIRAGYRCSRQCWGWRGMDRRVSISACRPQASKCGQQPAPTPWPGKEGKCWVGPPFVRRPAYRSIRTLFLTHTTVYRKPAMKQQGFTLIELGRWAHRIASAQRLTINRTTAPLRKDGERLSNAASARPKPTPGRPITCAPMPRASLHRQGRRDIRTFKKRRPTAPRLWETSQCITSTRQTLGLKRMDKPSLRVVLSAGNTSLHATRRIEARGNQP